LGAWLGGKEREGVFVGDAGLGEGLGYRGGARDRIAAVSSVPELDSAEKKAADMRAPAVSGCWRRDAYRFDHAGKCTVGRIPARADSVPAAFLPFFKLFFFFLFLTSKKVLFANKIE
jgi:hypothetical protein